MAKESREAELREKIKDEGEKLHELIEKCESDALMSKSTLHKDALEELSKIKKKYDAV